jgi:Flp pilus assembly protein TadD
MAVCTAANAATVELNRDRLGGSLKLLARPDRTVVDQAIKLIQRGDHSLALAHLSSLTKKNSDSSALRILSAYAMLQLGNLVGAFDEAKKAEASPDHDSYACLFLAKLALLIGDKEVCKRELEHIKGAGEPAAQISQIENGLKKVK